jgi:hypothetical protein
MLVEEPICCHAQLSCPFCSLSVARCKVTSMNQILITILLACLPAVIVQERIPPGTFLPGLLNSSMGSKSSKPGQPLKATVMQEIPLPDGNKIRRGAKIIGHVTSVIPHHPGAAAEVTIQFDRLEISDHRSISITTSLRALAALPDVEQAQLPATGSDRGASDAAYTTVQIGGDVVYRGGGSVAEHSQKIGKPAPYGVLVRVAPGEKCGEQVFSNDAPVQALWLFSANACGVYGYRHMKIAPAGENDLAGQSAITSLRGDFHIESGSGILLVAR